jgi:tetratricopeptide (TPR) repeat protein
MALLCGCSASYNGERLLWKAQRLSDSIAKDSSQATPEQVAEAVKAFTHVIDQAPGTIWAARAQLAIGSLHALQQAFDQARQAFALVVQNYHTYKDLALKARVATANTYEAEHNWEETVQAYYLIADYHPWSQVGLEAPIALGVMAEKQGKSDEATQRYERAVKIYTKRIPDAPTSEAAAAAKGYLAQAYQRLGQWDQAIATLEELLEAPHGVNRPLTLLMLGSIYQTRLHHPGQAGAFYTQLIQEFPDHAFAKVAQVQLQSIGLNLPQLDLP